MKKGNSISTLVILLLVMVCVAKANAASSVAVNLTTTKTKAQSSYALFDASKMYCEVTSVSKYPIKFQAYGRNNTTGIGTAEKTIVYNVNAKGTLSLSSRYNYHSIKLTGWNVGSEVKGCIGMGKIY